MSVPVIASNRIDLHHLGTTQPDLWSSAPEFICATPMSVMGIG